jgi:hypothetical protein
MVNTLSEWEARKEACLPADVAEKIKEKWRKPMARVPEGCWWWEARRGREEGKWQVKGKEKRKEWSDDRDMLHYSTFQDISSTFDAESL